VVGAGIIGVACAYFLARAGVRTLVLEEGFAGGGTTAAGMGHLVVMDDSEAQFSLAHYSERLWRELASSLPANCEFDGCGTVWVAEDAEQMEAVHAKHAYYAARGVASEVLDERSLAECEPELRAGLAGGLLVPGDAVVYQPNVARHLLAEAVRRGAELKEGVRVEALEAGRVRVGGEWIEARVVVNAAGAMAAALTPGLPIVPRKGHLVITERHPGFCRHQLVELGYLASAHGMSAESVAFNLQPRTTGQVLIGSSRELVGWDASINRALLARMLRRAADFTPRIAELNAIRTWTGFRPTTPDSLPLIGAWGERTGLWIAAGHEGLGITTALATGRLIADQITGQPPEIDPAPYAPGRVATQPAGVA